MKKDLRERVVEFEDTLYRIVCVCGCVCETICRPDARIVFQSFICARLRGEANARFGSEPDSKLPEDVEKMIAMFDKRCEMDMQQNVVSVRGVTLASIKRASRYYVSSDGKPLVCLADLIPEKQRQSIARDASLSRNLACLSNSYCNPEFLKIVLRLFPKAYFTCVSPITPIHFVDEETGSEVFVCPVHPDYVKEVSPNA